MTNRSRQSLAIDKARRARSLRQTPRCIWFAGLFGAGKSTIADLLEQQLHASAKPIDVVLMLKMQALPHLYNLARAKR